MADGFNPQALPDLTPHVEGAMPWTSLVDTTADQRATYLGRFVRGHGTVDSPDPGLVLQARTRRQVISGYLRQHVFLDVPGVPTGRVRLSALGKGAATRRDIGTSQAVEAAVTAVFPFKGPVAIVGTDAPARSAGSAAGQRLGEELADFLTGRGIESREAVAADPRREWIDHVLLVDYSHPSTVQLAAVVHLQPFLTVWQPAPDTLTAGVLQVIDLAHSPSGKVVAQGVADLHQVSVRTCPLLPGSACGDLCTMYGGPWVGRSITAAARWETRRARMIRALGCDTCGDGAITAFAGELHGGGRRTIPIRPDTAAPTRHDRLVGAACQRQPKSDPLAAGEC